jgi:hypothetical protein
MTSLWAAALETTRLATALRGSTWAYPLINAGHLLGVAMLLGAIIPLDLRLLGFWPTAPLAALWRILTRTAAAGLCLALVCGALLFSARATAYAASGLFITKMSVVGVALFNVWLTHRVVRRRQLLTHRRSYEPSPRVRAAALVSLLSWLSALFLGRLVGYF